MEPPVAPQNTLTPPRSLLRNQRLVLAAILVAAAVLRVATFYLPHVGGDQLLYTALALKLDVIGMKAYNLHGVNILSDPGGTLWGLQLAPEGEKGAVLRMLEGGNVSYYTQETLTNMPPLYSHLLMASRRLFAPGATQFPLVRRNLGWDAERLRPFFLPEIQFYAVWINFALALLLIFLTYRIGTLAYDAPTGLLAAAFLALNPVDLLTSQRLWADELLACLFALSAVFLIRGLQLRSFGRLLISGIACGLAITTKGSGLFLLLINSAFIVVAALFFLKAETLRARLIFIIKAGACFAIGALPFAIAWHGLLYVHYGTPLYMPHQEGLAEVSEWFRRLSLRNRVGQSYYFVVLFPVFALFYVVAAWQLAKVRTADSARLYLVLLPLTCIALLIYTNAREERYLLPAYAMIAVTTAGGMMAFLRFVATSTLGQWPKRAVLFGAIAVVAVSSGLAAAHGLTIVLQNRAIFSVR